MKSYISRQLCESALKHSCGTNFIAYTDERTVLWDKHPLMSRRLRASDPVVIMTILRHPIERILSSFWFEGKCDGDKRRPAGTNCTLREWTDYFVGPDSSWQQRAECKPNVWNHFSNYYIHILAGAPACQAIGAEEYRLAASRLAAFDAVFITERIRDATELIDELLPPSCALATPDDESSKPMPHSNLGRNRLVRNDDRAATAFIGQHNEWDLRLYAFATQLNELQGNATRKFGQGCAPDLCESVVSDWIPPPRLGLQLPPYLSRPQTAPHYGCSGQWT